MSMTRIEEGVALTLGGSGSGWGAGAGAGGSAAGGSGGGGATSLVRIGAGGTSGAGGETTSAGVGSTGVVLKVMPRSRPVRRGGARPLRSPLLYQRLPEPPAKRRLAVHQ